MTDISNAPQPRREFLGQIAASAVILAGAACTTPAAIVTSPAPTTAGQSPAPAVKWDDSWFGKLTSKHKALFDSPDIADDATLGVLQATRYLNGMREALGANDAQVVVVVRHKSIPFAFNDAMWQKYPIGEIAKVKSGDGWATRNVMAAPRGSRPNASASSDRPQGNLGWLISHGHFVLACDLATQGFAQSIAEKTKGDSRAITEELRSNLVAGVILQPNGVYAVHRAQEAGCTYIRST